MILWEPAAGVLTFPLPKHWRRARFGKLGFAGSAGSSEVGSGKHRGLRRWSTSRHSCWRICRRHQCIHTGILYHLVQINTLIPSIPIVRVLYISHPTFHSSHPIVVVFVQTLSPKAKGLFQRAIFQSGVATLGTYTSEHPLTNAKVQKYASHLSLKWIHEWSFLF